MNRASRVAALLALGLLALHLDFWRPQRPRVWLGWIPEELFWRIGWMLAAAAYLAWFCARVWPEGKDESDAAGGGTRKDEERR